MKKILIVDDNTDSLYLQNVIFTKNNFKVYLANNGEEALKILKKQEVDAILSDILMPVMDGFQLCSKCKSNENLAKIPFIFYTATYTSTIDEELALKLGAIEFIRKPQDADVLVKKVKKAINDEFEGTVTNNELQIGSTMKLYSESLIKKLEKKCIDLENEIEERKVYQNALVIQSHKNEIILNNMQSCLFIINNNGEIIESNKLALSLLSFSLDELKNETVISLGIFKTLNDFKNKIKSENTNASIFEATLKHKNGNYLVVEASVIHSHAIDNETIAIFCKDITAEKEAKKAIIDSEKRLSLALKNAKQGLWDWKVNENFAFYSKEFYEVIGYPKTKKLETEYFINNLVHPDDKQKFLQFIDGFIKGLYDVSEIEYRFLNNDGGYSWISSIGGVVSKNKDGSPNRIIGLIKDVTDRKLLDEYILDSERKLKSIYENSDSGIILLDSDFKILSFNQLAQLFSVSVFKNQIEFNCDFLELIKANENKELSQMLRDCQTEGQVIKFETCFSINETLSWFYMRLIPIKGEINEEFRMLIVVSEITDRKKEEIYREKITHDLFQRNQNLEQFSYIVSHNLRSPIANIIGLIDLLKTSNNVNSSENELIKLLATSSEKLDDVINELNIALQVKGELNENKEVVILDDIINDIKFSISNIIENEKVAIVTNFSNCEELFSIKSYIRSIFFNLISNSIKYKKPETSPIIEISSEKIDSKLVVTYSDNGLGIDLKANKGQVFGLYKRFHFHKEGKGMGLFMVKTQTETLGGTIAVSSEVNHGLKFVFTFHLQ